MYKHAISNAFTRGIHQIVSIEKRQYELNVEI
jgi:hypothetical protein